MPDRIECVYLIGSDASTLVKIGRSVDVQARLATLQGMSPVKLTVLWQTVGGTGLEMALHRHFQNQRSHGEWFEFPGHDAPEQVMAAMSVIATEMQQVRRARSRSPRAAWVEPLRGHRQAILDLASGSDGATNRAARQVLGVSPATAHRYLAALGVEGVIVMRGLGRAARWHAVTDDASNDAE